MLARGPILTIIGLRLAYEGGGGYDVAVYISEFAMFLLRGLSNNRVPSNNRLVDGKICVSRMQNPGGGILICSV